MFDSAPSDAGDLLLMYADDLLPMYSDPPDSDGPIPFELDARSGLESE